MRNQKGITLIELIAVMAIISIALMGIYSYFIHGQRMYVSGTDRANLHHNLRMTSERITRELRFATSFEVLGDWSQLPAGPEHVEPGNYYLYLNQENNRVYLMNSNGRQAVTEPVVSNMVFDLDGKRLSYSVYAAQRTTEFSLESTVILLNAANPYTPDTTLPAVRYTKP